MFRIVIRTNSERTNIVFLRGMELVLCKVRTKFLRAIKTNSFFQRPCRDSGSYSLAAHRGRLGLIWANRWEICCEKIATAIGLSPSTYVSLAYINLPILHTHLHILNGQTGGRIVETFQLNRALSDIGELLACQCSGGIFFLWNLLMFQYQKCSVDVIF